MQTIEGNDGKTLTELEEVRLRWMERKFNMRNVITKESHLMKKQRTASPKHIT